MRIDVPIQKIDKMIFFFFRGFGLDGGGAAVHSTAEHWSTFYQSNYTALLSHAVHFTAKL